QSGRRVAKDGERLAALQPIGVMACGEVRKTGKPVGDAFDGAEPHRTRPDSSQERGEHGCCRLMAPVAEEAGEPDAEHGAIEPGLSRSRIFHREILMSFSYF